MGRRPHAGLLSAIAIAAVLGCTVAARATTGTILIRDATVVSGTGRAPVTSADVLIVDGIIRAVDEDVPAPVGADVTIIDGADKTVLPGLIDCHEHLKSVPGAALRGDDAAALAAARKIQLRALVAAGVTTVLDAIAPPSVLHDMRAYVDATNLGPRIEGLAPILTPEHGYFADAGLRSHHYEDLWAPIGDDLSLIEAHLDDAATLDPVGVKVTVEDGYGPLPVWPIFDDAALARIRTSTAERDVPIFVHAIGADEYVHALKLEPHAFVHGGFMEEGGPDPATLEAVKASGAAVISTLAIADMILVVWQRERLDDPWLQMLVPEAQRATAGDEAITREMFRQIGRANAPWWIPTFLVNALVPWQFTEAASAELRDNALIAIKAMYDAGIPIVMGADMGNWPLFTSLFHAVGSIREMELLEQAGLPREEIIVAATSRAAMLIGRRDVGSIAVGKRADLIIANANPLEAGMGAFRDLAFVMKGGELRTPSAWMTKPTATPVAE